MTKFAPTPDSQIQFEGFLSWTNRSRISWILVVLVAGVYVGAARVGESLSFMSVQVPPVWPPSGIALAAILLFGYRIWPGIALGSVLVRAIANEPIVTICGIALGNTLEAVFGAWMLHRFIGFQNPLERLRDVLGLIILAAGISTTMGATIRVASFCLGGSQPWSQFASSWWGWWFADAMGVLVVAPVLLCWAPLLKPFQADAGSQWGKYYFGRLIEAGILSIGLFVSAMLVFAGPPITSEDFAFKLRVFPFAVWAALRFGQPGTTATTFIVTGLAVWGTTQGTGLFSVGPVEQRLLLLQTFMMVVLVTGLLIGAALEERKSVEENLRKSHALLSAISTGTTDAVFVKDLQGRYLMINPAGAALLGLSVDEVVGKDDKACFAAETAATIREREAQVLASGLTQTYEEVIPTAGIPRTFLSTKGPYRDHQGRIIGLIGIARDITDRKRAESAFRESHNLLQSVIEGIPEAIFVKDRQSRYLLVNSASARLVGKSVQEVLGQDDSSWLPLETAQHFMAADREVMECGQGGTYKNFATADGITRVRLTTKVPFLGVHGEIIGVLGISRDITDRNNAEEELLRMQDTLRENEERLRSALEAARMSTWDWDLQTNRINWSEGYEELFGMAPESFKGTYEDFVDRLHPDDRDHVIESMAFAKENKTLYRHEYRVVWPDGTIHWLVARGKYTGDDAGKSMRMLGVIMDVTPRKLAEQALAEKEHLYRSAIEAAGAVPYARNYLTNRFDYVGPGIETLLGYTPQEFTLAVWNGCIQQVYPFGKSTALSTLEASRWLRKQHRPGWWADCRVRNAEGDERWLSNAAVKVLDERGMLVGSLGLWQDITERKQAEQRVQEYADRLRALSHRLVEVQEEERRHLARELHDEIGQVFTAIGFNLHQLKDCCAPEAIPRLEESIAIVNQAIQQVRKLSFDLRPSMLDVLGLEAALRWYMDHQRQRTGMDIRLSGYLERRLPGELEVTCFRVIQEALSNAVRHAQAKQVCIELHHDDTELELVIHDDGRGFDPATAQEKAAVGGCFGVLGMQERIQLVGGTMAIVSKPGEGTRINCRLPLPEANGEQLDNQQENEFGNYPRPDR